MKHEAYNEISLKNLYKDRRRHSVVVIDSFLIITQLPQAEQIDSNKPIDCVGELCGSAQPGLGGKVELVMDQDDDVIHSLVG
ncbi:hypothetical protein Q3G72_000267 [Acer saccharum]|nr:hypothetical protein Q3G72_000267 [Acer saccharum]